MIAELRERVRHARDARARELLVPGSSGYCDWCDKLLPATDRLGRTYVVARRFCSPSCKRNWHQKYTRSR